MAYKRIWKLAMVIAVIMLLVGCVTEVPVRNLPGERAFLREMREIDKGYKIKSKMIEPRKLEIYVTSSATDPNTIGAIYEQTANYILSDQVFEYYIQKAEIEGLSTENLEYIYIYILIKKPLKLPILIILLFLLV